MTDSSQLSHTLLPAELRYFASPRDDWELLLLRARQLGTDTIVARVPWAWHAPVPGAFDFDGATDERRDLVGFVRLCGRLGLGVLLDPGPRHNDLLGAGAPAWLLQQHPSARALGPDGAPWLDQGGLAHPSALHPEFLRAARDWIAAFSAAMRALQAPSGPIVALHVGAAGTPDRLDYNQAASMHPSAPDLLPETLGTFAAWYDDIAAATTLDWLDAEGWTIPLRRGSLFWEQPGFLATPQAEPGSALLIELPGGPGHALLDAAPAPVGALLRSDGSACPDFWRVKMGSLLIGTAGADAAHASAPAELALANMRAPHHPLAARTAISVLEQRLRQASVAFDLLDLDAATPRELARYTLIVVPGLLALQPATQHKLAQCSNVVLLSDPADALEIDLKGADASSHAPALLRSSAPQLPVDISADQLAELIEERGGIARYTWADGANVDLMVRYGTSHTYLSIDNRRSVPYNGILAYRGRDGAVLHLHAGIGAGRAGMILLADDEVYGAAIDGDGAEGGWLARGLRSSAVFNTGAGALARCGEGLLLTALQSGRFQARRAEGWSDTHVYRLLLSGTLQPARAHVDATHIAVAYVAEDARGQTDMYLVLPDSAAPPLVHGYLATLLGARAAMLQRAATLTEGACGQHESSDVSYTRAVEPLASAAEHLETAAKHFTTLDEYSAVWSYADALCLTAITSLTQILTQARGALLASQLDSTAHETLERQIARIVRLASLSRS